MKTIILFGLSLFSILLVSAQKAEKEYVLLKGDTYTIRMFKSWLPPSAVKEYGEPFRKKGKYETTSFVRVNPVRTDRCGTSITVTEIKGCRAYIEVFQKDSLRWISSKNIIKVEHSLTNGTNIKRITVLTHKANRHPETKELSALQQINWYLQGKRNTYCVSFTSCTSLLELLPEVKTIVASLDEI